MSAAEDVSLSLDQDVCSEAQNALIHPNKRLAAELDWFVDADAAALGVIQDHIRNGEPISTDGLRALSKLNATIYNFSLDDSDDLNKIGYSILEIDELFSSMDVLEVTEQINVCRAAARLPEVQQHVVSQELNKKRESIRQVIAERLAVLSQSDYVELATLLAEKCVDIDDESGVILSDMIDQYELRMQSELEKKTSDIESRIEQIESMSSDTAIMSEIDSLIRQVRDWDKIAQPLQLKSQASGMPHEISEHLGRELRELALMLHNEKGLSEVSLTLVDAMQDVFAELGGLADQFEADSETLNDLIKGNKEAKAVLEEMESLQKTATDIKALFATAWQIENFLSRVKILDRQIKNLGLDGKLEIQLREKLCYMARDVAVTLHNDKNRTELALKMANALQTEFSDIPILKSKLSEDITSLEQQLMYKRMAEQRKTQQEAAQKSKNIGCLVGIGIFVLIMIISAIGGGSSSPSKPTGFSPTYSSGSSSSTGSSSTPKPTAPASKEMKFSSSFTSGTKVYVDIVSIFPSFGIYTQGSFYYTDFVCECKTAAGSTVWVYMTTSEYKTNFDASVSTDIYRNYADEVTFSSKRIHGTVISANTITSDLSADTGTYVIDFSSVGE